MKAVFGYGSLVDVDSASRTIERDVKPLYITLRGHRRCFNASWDGYNNNNNRKKYYFCKGTKHDAIPLLPVFQLTFLNVIQDIDASMVGILIPVTDEELENFDRREGMSYSDDEYRRIEVTQLCSGLPDDVDAVYVYSVLKPSPTERSRIASTYYDLCSDAHMKESALKESWLSDMALDDTRPPVIETDLNLDEY